MYLGMNHTNSLRKKSITFPGVKLRLGMERARKTTVRYFIGSKGRICRIYISVRSTKKISPLLLSNVFLLFKERNRAKCPLL